MAEMHQRIKTKEEFALESPVLQLGERGLEKDTGLEKIGDGVTRWNSLDYTGGGGSSETVPDISNLIVVAPHGTDANYPRPDALVVYWLGATVEPLNALDDDMWNGAVR